MFLVLNIGTSDTKSCNVIQRHTASRRASEPWLWQKRLQIEPIRDPNLSEICFSGLNCLNPSHRPIISIQYEFNSSMFYSSFIKLLQHLHLMEASACRRPETTWLSCTAWHLKLLKLSKLLSLFHTFSTFSTTIFQSLLSWLLTSPHLHVRCFPHRMHGSVLKPCLSQSQRSLSSSASLNTNIDERLPEMLLICHLRYLYISCIFICCTTSLHHIHTTSYNIQVHVQILCQSPPILCEFEITRIKKVQDEESTRNGKNHKKKHNNHVWKSYKNHITII